ncbi:zinc-binding dehydrogenase [Alkalibaculum sp. M08DMB]|uniref:Zinc-binding dehydrogenase n=1 Tax=Alkalibaculum sporogenes TaxID=2655001 RepID=A0A6A7KAC4_9FIRM|nr:NAD(P)-dependent alcohol dehydrogenase [Alkalibaculum sporogenes]MPW26458.1 zinc-binding dehydrogenase [Alkalibaculum sporogenes]
MLIKGAVTHNKGDDFVIENIELASPKADEVLVKITACGVCHTDAVARDQLIPVPLAAVLGHEGSGVVVEVGSSVTTIKPGDHVVLSYSSCGYCENCLTGKPYSCLELNKLNFGGVMNDGTKRLKHGNKELSTFFGQSSFATYAVANERNVVSVDKDVDLKILGPLGCGFQTGAGTVLNGLKPEFGTSIAVFGCGSVGLTAIMGAKIAGCEKIIAVGGTPARLELAKELGATHIVNRKQVADVVEEIKRITNGGVNYTVETSAVPDIVNQALYALRSLGTCAIVGATGDVTINIQGALMGEGKSMVGYIEGNSVPQVFIPKLIKYFKKGLFPIDKLVKVYDLEEINVAFEDSHKGITVKPIIKM